MIAAYLVWHLRRAWAPLTYTDQDPPAPAIPDRLYPHVDSAMPPPRKAYARRVWQRLIAEHGARPSMTCLLGLEPVEAGGVPGR
jgi:hypothetical protein